MRDSGGVCTTRDVPGATYTEARGIEAAGQIVENFVDRTAEHHEFLASPVPIPGAIWMLGAAFGGLGLMRRHAA